MVPREMKTCWATARMMRRGRKPVCAFNEPISIQNSVGTFQLHQNLYKSFHVLYQSVSKRRTLGGRDGAHSVGRAGTIDMLCPCSSQPVRILSSSVLASV